MSRQQGLFVAAREYDLPPRWDGWAVLWRPWADLPVVFICPPPRERSVCPSCGSLTARVMAHGYVALATSSTPERLANYDAVGKLGDVARLRLDAFRCPACQHDQVHDHQRDEWWDLDFTDYGDTGSLDPDGRW